MRVFVLLVLTTIAASLPVFAQSEPIRWGWGYGYSGLCGRSGAPSAHFGGGGELLLAGVSEYSNRNTQLHVYTTTCRC
jgi:hypothetical protein